jgi:hypothetical protein
MRNQLAWPAGFTFARLPITCEVEGALNHPLPEALAVSAARASSFQTTRWRGDNRASGAKIDGS